MAEEKKNKKEVDYGPGHPRGDHCGICTHFIPPASRANKGSCMKVSGTIRAADWCKLFSLKSSPKIGNK